MTYDVIISERALDDLFDLHRWISWEADAAVADAYQDRIDAQLVRLSEFPHRGTPQDHLMPGARSLSFERRISIFYRVEGSTVEILRIVSAARETRSLLS